MEVLRENKVVSEGGRKVGTWMRGKDFTSLVKDPLKSFDVVNGMKGCVEGDVRCGSRCPQRMW